MFKKALNYVIYPTTSLGLLKQYHDDLTGGSDLMLGIFNAVNFKPIDIFFCNYKGML